MGTLLALITSYYAVLAFVVLIDSSHVPKNPLALIKYVVAVAVLLIVPIILLVMWTLLYFNR